MTPHVTPLGADTAGDERLGYAVVRRAPFAEVSSQEAHLATPCAFLVFRKRLGP